MILGLGVNTRLTGEQGRGIDQPWVDLATIPGGKTVSRNRLVSVLLHHLLDTLARFEDEGFGSLAREWERYDVYSGRVVSLQVGDRRVDGIYKGIDHRGALLLQRNGRIHTYHGGEISLR